MLVEFSQMYCALKAGVSGPDIQLPSACSTTLTRKGHSTSQHGACNSTLAEQRGQASPGLGRGNRSAALTAAVARVVVDTQQQRVALGRIGVARQGVLQRGNHLVAVQRDHPVIVVGCTRNLSSVSSHMPASQPLLCKPS